MENIVGERFGRLLVTATCDDNPKYVVCQCDCGNTVRVRISQLHDRMKSCGCIAKERKQHKSGTRLYKIYHGMKARCYKETNSRYEYYGGRGITVCDEWLASYDNFLEWALSHGYRDDLTIDRIDVNGNYEPSNCRWATRYEQSNNTRLSIKIKIDGVERTLKQWAKETGINYGTALSRIDKGVPAEIAITPEPLKTFSEEEIGYKRISHDMPVLQFTIDGQFVKRYESVRQANIALNPSRARSSAIRNCCKGRTKTAYGYVWKYE